MTDDYNKIFHQLLPNAVNEFSPQIPYWPSSPQFGRSDKRSRFEGDSHYWGVWHDEEPFEMFEKKVPRFMSEFGFQSYPSLKTLSSWVDAKELNYNSPILQSHQKHPRGNELIIKYMEPYYNVPENFSDFIYVNQLLQAEGISTGIEAHRRAMPYCMGSLYWQLNDCWPVISWSSIDYEGRWKALQYFAKKSFEPIILSLERNDNLLNIYIVNDKHEWVVGYLNMQMFKLNGRKILEVQEYCKIKPDSKEILKSIDITKYNFKDLNNLFLNIRFDGNEHVSQKNFYFVKPKDLSLFKPEIKITIEKEDNHFVLVLLSDVLAKNVFVDCHAEGKYSDNYFDLIPGEEKTIEFYPDKNIESISFTTFSLWDTLGKKN